MEGCAVRGVRSVQCLSNRLGPTVEATCVTCPNSAGRLLVPRVHYLQYIPTVGSTYIQ
jgi:hypothetical protein